MGKHELNDPYGCSKFDPSTTMEHLKSVSLWGNCCRNVHEIWLKMLVHVKFSRTQPEVAAKFTYSHRLTSSVILSKVKRNERKGYFILLPLVIVSSPLCSLLPFQACFPSQSSFSSWMRLSSPSAENPFRNCTASCSPVRDSTHGTGKPYGHATAKNDAMSLEHHLRATILCHFMCTHLRSLEIRAKRRTLPDRRDVMLEIYLD